VTVSIAADTSGDLQRDVAGQPRAQRRVAGKDVGVGRDEQDVVERQRFLDQSHGLRAFRGAKQDYMRCELEQTPSARTPAPLVGRPERSSSATWILRGVGLS
jgi:hypothetical protein